MMNKSVLFFSLLSGTALLPGLVLASGFPTHTPKHTPKPEPVSFIDMAHSYKTAAVCFLGYGDCDPNAGFGSGSKGEDYTIDTAKQCQNEGFTKPNCNSVQVIDGVCPYNSSYGKGCKCASNLITCPAGQVGVGESCGGKYASCKCDPKLVSCASNQIGQGASCGGRYQSCACRSEYIYNSSNCKSPRSVSGASCGGKYTGCSCPSGVSAGTYGCAEYYASPCSSVCKKAYTDNCHKRTDNNSAVYGCMKYWSDCSSKCETPYKDNCRNRTAVIGSCPANATCTYFSDCSAKISGWSCRSGYKASGNSCVIASSELPILYGDGTVSKNLLTEKTPIGIVLDETNRLAMALTDVKKDGTPGVESMAWSSESYDIPGLNNCDSRDTIRSCDADGKNNTKIILADKNSGTQYAAIAANKFEPAGCLASFCKQGKWFLPSMAELLKMNDIKSVVNDSISFAGGTILQQGNAIQNHSYQSSTEGSYGLNRWLLDTYYTLHGVGSKTSVYNAGGAGHYVRPFIKY